MAIAQNSLRKELGDFSSTVCFKAVVIGIEEALGEKAAAIALMAAGRKRGKFLAEKLDLVDKDKDETLSNEEVVAQFNSVVGKEGTRLCIVDKFESNGDNYKVHARETVCSSGEEEGSPRECTFTLGAIQGFLEAFLGKRLRGKQIGSVLRGNTHDIFEYTTLG
jgi:predicted hydrocarbon binding protein